MRNVIIISSVVIVIIIILIMSQKSSAATAQSGLQGSAFTAPGQFIPTGGMGQVPGSDPIIDLISDSMDSIPTPKECRKKCRQLCKPVKGIGKRNKCKKNCKSDCAKGKNVITMYP